MTSPSSNPLPIGVLFVDKPAGITSHGVVAWVRRALGTRRVGHAGTLDPDATGLLIVGVGAATRLLTFLVGLDKRYEATIRLGMATTTDDAAGEVLAAAGCRLPVALEPTVASFRGTIAQRPSAVSAVKVDGRRAYARARAGESVELPERSVTVSEFEVLAVREGHDDGVPVVDLDVVLGVSSGTYVRALARDLGDRLGVGGHVTRLRRTAVGPFDLDLAVGLDDVEAAHLRPLGEVAAAVLPVVSVEADDAHQVAHGVKVQVPPDVPSGPVALVDPAGSLLAIATAAEGRWRYAFVVPV